MNDLVLSKLTSAIEALWRHEDPLASNPYAQLAFVDLRETCQRLYRSPGSNDAVGFFALSQGAAFQRAHTVRTL